MALLRWVATRQARQLRVAKTLVAAAGMVSVAMAMAAAAAAASRQASGNGALRALDQVDRWRDLVANLTHTKT